MPSVLDPIPRDDLRRQVSALVQSVGLVATARLLGLTTASVLRICAGTPVRAGTRALAHAGVSKVRA